MPQPAAFIPVSTELRPLCPTQQKAFDGLLRALHLNPLVYLWGEHGHGRTTVLRHLQQRLGGVLVDLAGWLKTLAGAHPLALEESFETLVRQQLEQHELVLLDDVDMLEDVVAGCGGSYPRVNLFEIAAKVVGDLAVSTNRRLVFTGQAPGSIRERAYAFGIPAFTPGDYTHIVRQWLPAPTSDRLDFAKVHRFACGLDAWDLSLAARWLADEENLETERFIEYLRAQGLSSNIDLSEVRQVSLSDLVGIDDLIQQLETHVVLPLENDELPVKYGLRPKRGVLLLGPPGTGKTTVGRALAHRLKGKFFRIDGTFIAGTDQFYWRVNNVFQQAEANAPAVIFIDDCDAIFEHGHEQGFYRYLLTLLDGLESESAGRVCVIMTAMKLDDLPPALIRSGRIELWLETRLPDAAGRRRMLEKMLEGFPTEFGAIDVEALVQATDGFTGADLGPVILDGKNLLAYDQAHSRSIRSANQYFTEAISAILANRNAPGFGPG